MPTVSATLRRRERQREDEQFALRRALQAREAYVANPTKIKKRVLKFEGKLKKYFNQRCYECGNLIRPKSNYCVKCWRKVGFMRLRHDVYMSKVKSARLIPIVARNPLADA